MNRIEIIAALSIAFFFSSHAYEQPTHVILSHTATMQLSTLKNANSGALTNLGLGASAEDPAFSLPASNGQQFLPVGLIQYGAFHEDDVDIFEEIKPGNHFFDPQNGGVGIFSFDPSPTWALATNQGFSYADARTDLYLALTSPAKSERDQKLGAVFEALGHIIHHLQDMAQPQHVRGDTHIVLVNTSEYESFTLDRANAIPMLGYPVADYGIFSTPRAFWETANGEGIAQFTSNNFVSIGTNFRGTPHQFSDDGIHPLPAANAATPSMFQIEEFLGPAGPNQRLRGQIWFLKTPVDDRYQAGAGGENDFTSAYSIFNSDLTNFDVRDLRNKFTLNRINYSAANDYLLPRAVAYSAGMIDYFFRGQIEISLPDDGVYSVVDHAVANQVGQGFTTLKVKLRNSTKPGQNSNGNSVPQDMMGGTLVAIANYTLNKCYRPDLAGEITDSLTAPSGCTPGPYLPEDEKVTQSTAIMAANLSTAPTPFTFDFSAEPIPINARDLRIQVVYQGTVGSEADGIAIGSLDISAPTYLMIYNSSDYYNFNGVLKKSPEEVPTNQGLRNSEPEPLEVQSIQITGGASIAGSTMVPVNGYVRLALLVDGAGTTSYRVVAGFPDPPFSSGLFTSEFPDYPPHLVRNSKVFPAPVRVINGIGVFRGIPENHLISYLKSNPGSAALTPEQQAQLSSKIAGDPGPTAIPINF